MSNEIDMVSLARQIINPLSEVQRLAEERKNPVTRSATRGEWQRALEENLVTFNGDAIETQELLAALMAALKNRYDNLDLSDIEHEAKQLSEALDELDRTVCSQHAIDDYIQDDPREFK